MIRLIVLLCLLNNACVVISTSSTYKKKNCEDEAMVIFDDLQEERADKLIFVNYGCYGEDCALNFYHGHKPGTLIFDGNNCVLRVEW